MLIHPSSVVEGPALYDALFLKVYFKTTARERKSHLKFPSKVTEARTIVIFCPVNQIMACYTAFFQILICGFYCSHEGKIILFCLVIVNMLHACCLSRKNEMLLCEQKAPQC